MIPRKWICFFLLVVFVAVLNATTYKIAFLCSTSKGEGRFFAGAFFRALDSINNDSRILQNITLDYLFNDTKMDTLEAIRAMTSQHNEGTIGFIGPDASCDCESTNAAAWNLPMIAYKCHDSSIGKNEQEVLTKRTFARTQPSTAKVSKSIISILQHYSWQRLTLVVGSSAIWNETSESLKDLCKLHNIYVNRAVYFKEPYAASYVHMYDIAMGTKSNTRIYVFLGDYHALIDFVRILRNIVGSAIGDYVVIAMDDRLYEDDPATYLIRTPFETEEHLTPDNIQAFDPVLLLVPQPPTNKNWDTFLDDVRKRNEDKPINGPKAFFSEISAKLTVPIYSAYLYDAVNVYAHALDEAINNGSDANDGLAIISQIRSRTFTSILGYQVYIDQNGDAEGNYTLLKLQYKDNASGCLTPVAGFTMTDGGVGIPALSINRPIEWPNGKKPDDSPVCGFDGEKCKHEYDWTPLSICISVAAVVLVAGGFFLRHYLYEQKLARLLWKVDYKDIHLVDSMEDILPTSRKKERRSHPWKFLLSYGPESERAALLCDTQRDRSTGSDNGRRVAIGCYKGTIVAIKHVTKKHVEINRNLKKLLQLRKELNHDNVTRFIGACVETPHVYILTQYCARGSLQDIMENEDMHLDDMFISSLVTDLMKAMTFIHDSEIQVHGNLKSSNCLVDSRWVLTVSDFGLHQLTSDRSDSISDVNNYYKNLIWKAPELLRTTTRVPTQKGDTYAFGLILYELHGRKGPFGNCGLTYKEIYEKVKQPSPIVPFRPCVDELSCDLVVTECIQDCWHEDPEHRPEFKLIRNRLKPMGQGLKSNIFDNMLAMMEKYAHNLEGLVTERTELLSEEKKMTENLLLRMLPRFVADQLKQGKPVVPENYDSVSIYFSDIVGFTALSAESTPLEVVCMLNDLYTCFDSIVENYDVFKIETIGDAYMVVSGLPVRNADMHAGEIASMALHLLRAIKSFKIRHRPQDTLKLRIGIHSGPCVAGVVGLKMPRYTLFGDTVNTASRMESTGVPLQIHCSADITAILEKLGGYTLVERGYVSAKGKGQMLTYFLEREDELARKRRISSSKFSRTNSPRSNNSDVEDSIFGKSTIHPQFWPNGTMDFPGFYTPDSPPSPVVETPSQVCDCCGKDCDKTCVNPSKIPLLSTQISFPESFSDDDTHQTGTNLQKRDESLRQMSNEPDVDKYQKFVNSVMKRRTSIPRTLDKIDGGGAIVNGRRPSRGDIEIILTGNTTPEERPRLISSSGGFANSTIEEDAV